MKEGHAEEAVFGLFDAYGIEIEYMIVDAETLDVLPITDRVMHAMAGEYADEVEAGALCSSPETKAKIRDRPSTVCMAPSTPISAASTRCCVLQAAG